MQAQFPHLGNLVQGLVSLLLVLVVFLLLLLGILVETVEGVSNHLLAGLIDVVLELGALQVSPRHEAPQGMAFNGPLHLVGIDRLMSCHSLSQTRQSFLACSVISDRSYAQAGAPKHGGSAPHR